MPTPLSQKPATAAWIVRERKRLKLKPRDLVDRLAAQGLTVSEATVKVWESNANRRPAPENLEGLERIFESSAPANGTPSGDQSALVQAVDRQTAMLERVLSVIVARLPSTVDQEQIAAVLEAVHQAQLVPVTPGTSRSTQSPRTGDPGNPAADAPRKLRPVGAQE